MKKRIIVDEYKNSAKYYDFFIGPFLKNIRNEIIKSLKLEKKTNLIEIASGTGEQAIYFSKFCENIIGIDISQSMINEAKKKLKKNNNLKVNFICADARKLPFNSETFDISTITLGLHEMDPKIRTEILNEMIRITKKNGKIIIADYIKTNNQNFKTKIIEKIIISIEKFAGEKHYKNYKNFISKNYLENIYKNKMDSLTLISKKKALSNNLGIYKFKKIK